MIAGSPALRWLIGAKLRGTLRKQVRRLKRPAGIVFGIFGAIIFGFWFLSLALGAGLRGAMFSGGADPRMVRVFCLVMTLLTLTGAFSHRGVVMPREEIERLFAGPLSRADIVRYRMLTNSGRYILSGVVFALLSLRSLPHPIYSMVSVFVATMTLPLAGQAAALMLGSAEHRFADKWRKGARYRILQTVTILLVFGVIMLMMFGGDLFKLPSLGNVPDLAERALDWPPIRFLLAPFTPWSNAMTATNFAEFAPSFGIVLVFWVLLFEFAARLPVDFRELSLDTSANVAKRIRDMRSSGMGASSGKAAVGRLGKRVPWLFGRTAFGAVAWIKLGSLLRKARGTLIVSGLIITAITTFAIFVSRDGGGPFPGAAIVATVGTLYLCGALRFDFRADIDRLEAFKCWPLRPSQLFVANLLPQMALVSFALAVAIGVHAAVCGGFPKHSQQLLLGIPLIVFGWMALDNAVFLFLPQRTIAGQEGILQHLGRSIILLFTRGVIVVLVAVLGGFLVLAGEWLAGRPLEPPFTLYWGTFGALALLLLLVDLVLALVGGWALRRLDVSRIPK